MDFSLSFFGRVYLNLFSQFVVIYKGAVKTEDTIYLVKVSTKLADRIENYDEDDDIENGGDDSLDALKELEIDSNDDDDDEKTSKEEDADDDEDDEDEDSDGGSDDDEDEDE